MDNRNSILDRYASGMADIWLPRIQISTKVTIIFNSVERDHYQDPTVEEECRVEKVAAVKKNSDMNYVQELFGEELLEDDLEQIPWVVSITMTGLPRAPKMDDMVIIDGLLYDIAMVKPKNRNLPSMLSLLIYPERARPLELYSYNRDFNISYEVDSLAGTRNGGSGTVNIDLSSIPEGEDISVYQLQQLIISTIYENNNQEITGSGLQNVLLQIKNKLSDGFYLGGIVNKYSSPLDQKNVWYLTQDFGHFSNFDLDVANDGLWKFISWNFEREAYVTQSFCYSNTTIDEILLKLATVLDREDIVQTVYGANTDKVPSQNAVREAIEGIVQEFTESISWIEMNS